MRSGVPSKSGVGRRGGDSYLYLYSYSYLYLREGVQKLVIVQLRITIDFSLLQQPGEVEVGQDGGELEQRLQQDSEHGADHGVERGQSRRVAPR